MRIYTARNYLSTATYYTIGGGIVAGTIALTGAPIWLIATATSVVVGLNAGVIFVAKKIFEENLKKHPDRHVHSPQLGKIAEELGKKAGLRPDEYQIYDFGVEEDDFTPFDRNKKNTTWKDIAKEGLGDIGQMPQAAAFHLGKPRVMIS